MSQAVSAAESDRLPRVTTDLLDSAGWEAQGPVHLVALRDSSDGLVTAAVDDVTEPAEVTLPTSGACAPVRIDLLGSGEWSALRSARLAALRDSPEAFVGILAVEENRTPEEWIVGLTSSTWVVVRDGHDVVGIACLTAIDPGAPEDRFIESVWVDPRYRGQSARLKRKSSQSLVRRMLHKLEWRARADGAKQLRLWVLKDNQLASDAYLKLGFDPMPYSEQDSPKRRDDGTPLRECLMVKPLF